MKFKVQSFQLGNCTTFHFAVLLYIFVFINLYGQLFIQWKKEHLNTEFWLFMKCTEAPSLELYLLRLLTFNHFLLDKPVVMIITLLPDYWNWLILKPIPLYNELQKLYIKRKITYNSLFLNMKTILITILQINTHNYSNYDSTITHWYLLL